MPYHLSEDGKTVMGPGGKPVPGGKHGSKASALRHLRALEINVKKGDVVAETMQKGDVVGHDFHGNQYVDVAGGTPEQQAQVRAWSARLPKSIDVKKMNVRIHSEGTPNQSLVAGTVVGRSQGRTIHLYPGHTEDTFYHEVGHQIEDEHMKAYGRYLAATGGKAKGGYGTERSALAEGTARSFSSYMRGWGGGKFWDTRFGGEGGIKKGDIVTNYSTIFNELMKGDMPEGTRVYLREADGKFAKGDVPGHEFHGNQWTEGGDSVITPVEKVAPEQEARTQGVLDRAQARSPIGSKVAINTMLGKRLVGTVKGYEKTAYGGVNVITEHGAHDTTITEPAHEWKEDKGAFTAGTLKAESGDRQATILPPSTAPGGDRRWMVGLREGPMRSSQDSHNYHESFESARAHADNFLSTGAFYPPDNPSLKKGDVPSHEFHGNQWTAGGGGDSAKADKMLKLKELEARRALHVLDEAQKPPEWTAPRYGRQTGFEHAREIVKGSTSVEHAQKMLRDAAEAKLAEWGRKPPIADDKQFAIMQSNLREHAGALIESANMLNNIE